MSQEKEVALFLLRKKYFFFLLKISILNEYLMFLYICRLQNSVASQHIFLTITHTEFSIELIRTVLSVL